MKKVVYSVLLVLISVQLMAQNRLETVSPALDSLAMQPFKTHLDSIRQHRPTVALVLSGGGAKGAAHVGALRYLESIGMPVDIVLGTSIGGLVGGLYSVGYRSSYLDTLMRGMDWPEVLGDRIHGRYISYDKKQYDSKYLLSIPFYKDGIPLEGKNVKSFAKNVAASFPGGLVAGQNVTNLISSLTVHWQDSLSFAKLPIPFVCVATDMVSGKAKVWYGGNLLTAMRSTMSIPGLFAPVKTDGMVLVDGGMRDNYPIDIARALGADIVIGVTLSQGFKKYEEMNNLMDLMVQLTDMYGRGVYENNLPLADINIHPDLKGYDMLSFDPQAIDIMIGRGYDAAVSCADTLEALLGRVKPKALNGNELREAGTVNLSADKINIGKITVKGLSAKETKSVLASIDLPEGPLGRKEIEDAVARLFGTGAFETVNYSVSGDNEPYELVFHCNKGPLSRAGFGARFDNEELVSVLLNLGFNVNSVRGSSLDISGKIGVNPYVSATYKYKTGLGLAIGAESFYRYVDRNKFIVGGDTYHAIYHQFKQSIYLSSFSHSFTEIKAGARTEYTKIGSLPWETGAKNDTYFCAFANVVLDNTDDVYFPSKGLRFKGSFDWYPFSWKEGKLGIYRAVAEFSAVAPMGSTVALIPSLYASAISGNNNPFPFVNLAGGLLPGRYLDAQIPFAGLSGAFVTADVLGAGRLDLRFRLAANHYLTGTYNLALDAASVKSFFKSDSRNHVHGAALEYAWNTIAGPFRLGLWWNSLKERASVYFSIGKNF